MTSPALACVALTATIGCRWVPGHHPGITRGRVNLTSPGRGRVPRPRSPGGDNHRDRERCVRPEPAGRCAPAHRGAGCSALPCSEGWSPLASRWCSWWLPPASARPACSRNGPRRQTRRLPGCPAMKPTRSRPQFWSRLTASLAARWPDMGSDAALILERPSWDDPELVDSLARDLAELPAPAAVVIDDAQFAEASQRTLASLAQRLPAHVRLLVASQHNPVFSTSRLRLAGLITELRADDLAFTAGRGRAAARAGGPGTRTHRRAAASLPHRGLARRAPDGRPGDPRRRRPARGDRRLGVDDAGGERLPGQRGHEPAAARPGRLLDGASASWTSSTPSSARPSAARMTLAGSLTAWSLTTCSSTRSTAQANGSASTRCSRPSCGPG